MTGEIERSLESASVNNLAIPVNQANIGRQMYSPISRPNSTDCHTTTTTSSNHANHVHVVSLLPTVTTPSSECVEEGLAASLRDCLRTPAEDMQEPVGSSSSTAEQKDQTVGSGADESPNKRKRLSVDSNPDISREKKQAGETHTQKWQDKFDSRFDRIFTFASTEMDKRRRSTESCSPRTEPFSSPRGKEPIGITPNESTSNERTPDRKSDSKSSHSSRKDKQKESKTSEKKRDKSKDRDKRSRSKSSREKDREKDKDRDKEHRKHSSSSKHSHNHEKKKAEVSVVDKEREKEKDKEKDKDKDKVREREKEKDKKESNEKRSDERAEKHKHRDKGRERDRHREKHRDREPRSSKETKLPKMKQERKEESNSATESVEKVRSFKSQEEEFKEERSNNEAPNCQLTTLQTDSVVVNEASVNGTVKMEEEMTDERLHEYNNEGHHHFKKRMVQSQMDWQSSDAEPRRDEKYHQPPVDVKPDSSLGLDTYLGHPTSHQVTTTVELKNPPSNPVTDEYPSQKQYSKRKHADWSTQVTPAAAQLSQTDSSAFLRTGLDIKADSSSTQHQHPTSSNPPRGFSNLNTGAPLPHPASTKLPLLPQPHAPLPSVTMNIPYSSSTYDLPSSDINSQSYSRQFQQTSSQGGPHSYGESNYLTG